MALECTLVRGPSAHVASDPEELTIEVPDGAAGLHLQALLTESRGTSRLTVSGRDVSSLTVGVPPLVAGAVLVDNGTEAAAGTADNADPQPALLLLTHAGPAAGSVFPLPRGFHRLGRDASGISIPDPGLSREHAQLEVSATSVCITAQAAGTVFIDGKPLRRGTVTTSSSIQCGNSAFSILAAPGAAARLPQDAGQSVAEPLEVRRASPPGTNKGALAIAAILPIVFGVALAVATGTWTFLAFTAVSAISMLVPALSGRRGRKEFQRMLRTAVGQDSERRLRSAPSAARILLHALATQEVPGNGRRGTPPLEQPSIAPRKGPVWLRLGTASLTANIRPTPDDPRLRLPSVEAMPVVLDPSATCVSLVGKPDHASGMIRFMLMQLASFPMAMDAPVIVLGHAEHLPITARFLPNFALATDAGAALTALNRLAGNGCGTLVVADPAEAGSAGALRQATAAAGWHIIQYIGDQPTDAAWAVVFGPSGTHARLCSPHGEKDFIPDLVPADVFSRFCRAFAGQRHITNADQRALPALCSLEAVLPSGPRSLSRRWSRNEQTLDLTAVLGTSATGLKVFDFLKDGPHLLVAGTTGSGKSELLRTIVASLACTYPPARVVFLLIDFKGGSGLGPLKELPHCVGLITDLASHNLSRSLTSLRSEVRRREGILAAAGASSLRDYQRSEPKAEAAVPRLVVVVDEFRMMVDEAPAALGELMRIATIGRSLGIHLVMATQRPQGALTADIRANVTSSIALRVQSEGESLDVINTKDAFAVGLDQPGRAFLVRASAVPEEFQSAILAGAARTAGHSSNYRSRPVQVLPAIEAVVAAKQQPDSSTDTAAETERLVSAALTAWSSAGGIAPSKPIADPLPDHLPWEPSPGLASVDGNRIRLEPQAHSGAFTIRLGLLDRPEEQSVKSLDWQPAAHGHLAMVGSPGSGIHESFRAASASLAADNPSHHLYILDAAGILDRKGGSEPYGAFLGLHQLPLAVRVLDLLSQEMAKRRSSPGSKPEGPRLVLIVSGWCAWASAIRKGPFAWVEDLLQDIIRDGTPLGITVLVCGERELVRSRFFAAIPNRAFFPSGSTEEARFHWPRMPETGGIPGRAVTFGPIASDRAAVAQFRSAPDQLDWPFRPLTPTSRPPFVVRPLPAFLSTHDFVAGAGGPGAASLDESPGNTPTAWIGVGGDAAQPLGLPLRAGSVSLILGGPGAGKTSLLDTLESLNTGVSWIRPDRETNRDAFWAAAADSAAGQASAQGGRLLGGRRRFARPHRAECPQPLGCPEAHDRDDGEPRARPSPQAPTRRGSPSSESGLDPQPTDSP
ncbi:FtsK/SpoIIIE domain-containing protein [Paenarthrobacter sp. S56]|uniref:FtsK/SpoIIIE domain-containing protein n=1 Tax=Paenarthrobacter sp. S56 TaxID=3138179 RepID=UPI003219F90F